VRILFLDPTGANTIVPFVLRSHFNDIQVFQTEKELWDQLKVLDLQPVQRVVVLDPRDVKTVRLEDIERANLAVFFIYLTTMTALELYEMHGFLGRGRVFPRHARGVDLRSEVDKLGLP
jgi:hypothetical protein